MDDLEATIKRLEAAAEGSRELDHWITASLLQSHGAYKNAAAWVHAAQKAQWASPHYTTSIDAALTLGKEQKDKAVILYEIYRSFWVQDTTLEKAICNGCATALRSLHTSGDGE